uniref:Uncharacterized protein n=1 Tax=Tanacetum cinerariifolium TaxID=118510 RepID=A0A6L2M4B8_TANCI|nr:hypothetical protein [Tanacetum cinerariifolium]
MVAILEKYEHNIDFHQIVDFVEASHIRIETTDEGTKILATVDGKPRTISESSIRRNLKLNDEAGINSLLDAELFENLALMGVKVQELQLSPITPSPEAQQSSPTAPSSPPLPPATTKIIPTFKPTGDNSQGEACPTVTGLKAGHDRTRQTLLRPLLCLMTQHQGQQTKLATKIAAQDLEIASLKARIKMLEDKDAEGVKPSREDATIKWRSLETGEEGGVERSTERGSNGTEELVNVLISLDAVNILTSGVQVMVELEMPKKEKIQEQIDVQMARELEEEMARDAQRMNEQIKMDAEIARIHAEKELQMLIDEEGERMKRKVLRLDQESPKKMKTSEDVLEEDLKEMMELVPVEETLVRETLSIRQATSDNEKELWLKLKRLYEPDVEDQLWTHTQALMHDPVEWRLYDTCGVHHVLSKDQEIFMLVEKQYPLRKGLAIMMISNKLQVENYSKMASDLIQKIHKIANTPRQRHN